MSFPRITDHGTPGSASTHSASGERADPLLTVRRAERWRDRLRGLLGEPAPAPGHALLITPCTAVHTAFMAYPIDVVFLDREGCIRKVVDVVPPWRIVACLSATQTLELAAGEARRLGLAPGRTLPAHVLDPTAHACGRNRSQQP